MSKTEHSYLRDLYEVAMAINSAGSPESILRSVVESVTKAMKVKGCSIMLLTPDKKSLVHTVSYGLSDNFIKQGPRLVEKSLPETMRRKGSVSIVPDLRLEPGRVQYPDVAIKEGLISILAVPMKLKDNIIGELRVYTAKKRDFTRDDIDFVQAVANLGAIAMDNARLYETLQKAYQELTSDIMTFRFM